MAKKQLYIAGADLGSGGTNVVIENVNLKGKVLWHKEIYMPSVRAAIAGQSLGLGDMELQLDYVTWRGVRYVHGNQSLLFPQSMSRHLGINRYGGDLQIMLAMVALAQADVPDGSQVHMMLLCPPGMFKEVKPRMMEAFADTFEIQLKGEATPRRYTIIPYVFPEAVSGMGAYLFDASGEMVKSSLFNGKIGIVDLGVHTADIVPIIDGRIALDNLDHATVEDAGVSVHIRLPVLRELHKLGADFQTLTEDHIDEVLRHGLLTGDYTLRTQFGQTVNLSEHVKFYAGNYARFIADNVIDNRQRLAGLTGTKGIVMVGGGSMFVEGHLLEWYPGKVLDRSEYAHATGIIPVWLNAVGALRFLKYRLLVAGKA